VNKLSGRFKVVISNSPHPNFDVEKEILNGIADLSIVWCNSADEVIQASRDTDAFNGCRHSARPTNKRRFESTKEC
jgi:hypothetical protein